LRLLTGSGLPGPRARKDLAILGRAAEAYLAEKILAAFLGLLLPVLIAGMLAAAGHSVSPALPAIAVVACAAGGFFLPDAALHSQAIVARRDFRHALAGFLDLAEAALAGGAGIERALSQAADTGTGPAFHALRKALATANITARSAHDALTQLGNELGVTELVETAGAFTLAGTEGSKIRTSLATKADSLREHDLADTEANAAAATERMAAPLVLTFAGFLLILAYPATMHVMGAL
jgi:Flp pilus assembly protein TadB